LNKRQKNRILWLIVWGSLLILILYSPIGSPDLYSTHIYSVRVQNVSINDGVIQNASKIKQAQENNDPEMGIPDVSSGSAPNYSAGSYQSANSNQQGSSYSAEQPQSYQNNNSTGSAGGGSFIPSGGSSLSSAASSGNSMKNGISTLATTTNLTNSVKKQAVTTYTANSGGTDPGGDPIDNPIPVGDGWGVLTFFCILYILVKKVIERSCKQGVTSFRWLIG
jgi:hypothetical protein